MILVDSSVWVDYFRGAPSREVERLDALLGGELLAVGDIVLAEVLQGLSTEHEFREAVAAQAARNFRALRALDVTVRKTIDTLIATRCIDDDLALLYSDRDFDPFVRHLGLESAAGAGGSLHE